ARRGNLCHPGMRDHTRVLDVGFCAIEIDRAVGCELRQCLLTSLVDVPRRRKCRLLTGGGCLTFRRLPPFGV
ncbi:hypothetical protein, partial [Salmonella enterica]|uniref:hypothetical protein n=1 Tax=Salmonella enterica TaxID=28901 RepID=UPI003297A456